MQGAGLRPAVSHAPTRFACRSALALLACVAAMTTATAQTAGGGLTDPQLLDQYNALERAAAFANQGTYETLFAKCFDPQNPPSDPACSSPQVRIVFDEVKELVDTANALLGTPTGPGLGLDLEGLRFALRWTAAEEMAAQGSATTVFAASQLSTMSARLSSLRWGVSGPRTTHLERQDDDTIRVADAGQFGVGGGAGADDEIFSRWSWYVDGSFGYGSKDPTDLEDAFDFDGQEITAGADYRFSKSLAVGAMVGYTSKEVDFDSTQSVVDGGIETDGYSLLAYVLWEGEHAYLNAGLGYQELTHDSDRRITYPSQNAQVPPVDSLATSSTDSSSVLASLGAGYAWNFGGFGIEPSVEFAYTDASVDGFIERSRDLTGQNPEDPFGLRIGSQSIESLDGAAGVRLNYVFTPGFGVLVPYLTARYHLEMLDDVRRISALYADAYELLLDQLAGDPDFNVPTDEPDDDYYTLAAGVSVVLQSGLMGYVQYLEVLDLDHYDDAVITAGIRYEFGR